jgi:ABC-type multidrug transport system ATPase subunit
MKMPMVLANPDRITERDAVPVITARGLTRRFGDFLAVNDIDVHVTHGEVFGLLGANGAGKTTAIRMLCGMLPPTAGEIQVAGIDMVRHARRARGHIGYVAQRFALYGDLTVTENLELQAGLYGLRGARRRERLQWALSHLDLEKQAGLRADTLPLGFKRRMALAAALLHEPEVLFLDEPTSGVDPLVRQHFWELIYGLAESGIGILVTTHYMDEAIFCDRLSLMHAGRIIARGTPMDLLERPLPTPLIELFSTACPRWVQILNSRHDIREIIPHAGHLRIRLMAGTDVTTVINDIRATATRLALDISRLEPAIAELEDVFVAVLEEAAVAAPS